MLNKTPNFAVRQKAALRKTEHTTKEDHITAKTHHNSENIEKSTKATKT